MIMEVDKSKISRVGLQAPDPGQLMVQNEAWSHFVEKFPPAWERLVFCSIHAFNWLVEAYAHCGGEFALFKIYCFKY